MNIDEREKRVAEVMEQMRQCPTLSHYPESYARWHVGQIEEIETRDSELIKKLLNSYKYTEAIGPYSGYGQAFGCKECKGTMNCGSRDGHKKDCWYAAMILKYFPEYTIKYEK